MKEFGRKPYLSSTYHDMMKRISNAEVWRKYTEKHSEYEKPYGDAGGYSYPEMQHFHPSIPGISPMPDLTFDFPTNPYDPSPSPADPTFYTFYCTVPPCYCPNRTRCITVNCIFPIISADPTSFSPCNDMLIYISGNKVCITAGSNPGPCDIRITMQVPNTAHIGEYTFSSLWIEECDEDSEGGGCITFPETWEGSITESTLDYPDSDTLSYTISTPQNIWDCYIITTFSMYEGKASSFESYRPIVISKPGGTGHCIALETHSISDAEGDSCSGFGTCTVDSAFGDKELQKCYIGDETYSDGVCLSYAYVYLLEDVSADTVDKVSFDYRIDSDMNPNTDSPAVGNSNFCSPYYESSDYVYRKITIDITGMYYITWKHKTDHSTYDQVGYIYRVRGGIELSVDYRDPTWVWSFAPSALTTDTWTTANISPDAYIIANSSNYDLYRIMFRISHSIFSSPLPTTFGGLYSTLYIDNVDYSLL